MNQGGESPSQVYLLRPVADCNCVTVMWGGEQQEANDQPVGRRTQFRPADLASLPRTGEAQNHDNGMRRALTGKVTKRPDESAGGRRQDDRKVHCVNRGALPGKDGVHAWSEAEEPPGRSQSIHTSNEVP